MPRIAIPCTALLLALTGTFAQGHRAVLTGCLRGGPPADMYLGEVPDGQLYRIKGDTSSLKLYSEREVTLEGTVDLSTDPWPSFHVIALKQVLPLPKVASSASFDNASAWRQESDATYGITFAHPADFTRIAESEWGFVPSAPADFASMEGVVTIGRFKMPSDLFPNSNYVDGAFGVFVNPKITNAQSCGQFADADPRFRSVQGIEKIQYQVYRNSGAAAGTFYNHHNFHTFQNGLCYDIGFMFAEWNTGNSDIGCITPSVSQGDEEVVIHHLLAGITFALPIMETTPAVSGTPRILEFKSSSLTANSGATRGKITFTWSTQNADYVEFSYHCDPAPNGAGVVISEGNVGRQCENNNLQLSSGWPNRSANGSVDISLGNFFRPPRPLSVTVTITPFSHATAYREAARSITIQVNPFPSHH